MSSLRSLSACLSAALEQMIKKPVKYHRIRIAMQIHQFTNAGSEDVRSFYSGVFYCWCSTDLSSVYRSIYQPLLSLVCPFILSYHSFLHSLLPYIQLCFYPFSSIHPPIHPSIMFSTSDILNCKQILPVGYIICIPGDTCLRHSFLLYSR